MNEKNGLMNKLMDDTSIEKMKLTIVNGQQSTDDK